MKKVLFTATVDSHILHFHIPYLKWFKEQGYEVHVATNGDEVIPVCDVKHKISFARSPFKTDNVRAIKELKKVIEQEKFEIIHCHTPMGSVVTRIAAKKARKQYQTKVIYTAHGFHFYKGAPAINWILFYPIEKWISKYTDCLITINEEDYTLAKKKFHAKKIELIHGVGIDLSKFENEISKEEKEKIKQDLKLDKNAIIIIYVAEINKNKNQIMIINQMEDLVKQNQNLHLLFAGDGILKDFLEKLVETKKLEKNVHFLGYRRDICNLLKIADIAISCSQREGLPINVVEAMATGLPVIATNVRGQRDLIIKGKNGYIINNETEMKNRILEMIKMEKNTRIEMGKSRRKEVEKYNIENVLQEYEKKEIYRENKPIKILHVIRAMNVGGAETLIMNLYRNIDTQKVQFDFLVSGKGFFDEEILQKGGILNYIPYLTEVGPIAYKKNIRKFLKEHPQYKIIHSHIDQVSGIILEAAKKENVSVRIAHSHSNNNTNNFIIKIYKKILQKKINKNANNFFACSEKSAKWLFKEKSNLAYIINNGIEIERFSFSQEKRKRIRNEFEIAEEIKIIGHIGSLITVKNHEFLLKIFKEYQEKNEKTILMLVGTGNLEEILKEQVRILGIEENVYFVGRRADSDAFYSAFDIMVFPSLYEGISTALIEAQTNGLPIVASDTVDRKTNITETIKFISLQAETNKWTKLIDENISNRKQNIEKIKEMGFDIKEVAKKLEIKYEELYK